MEKLEEIIKKVEDLRGLREQMLMNAVVTGSKTRAEQIRNEIKGISEVLTILYGINIQDN